MASNNFKAFAAGTGANVTAQADYEALPALSAGFTSGKAASAQVNKAIRQATTMASILAQFISDQASVDVLDNGSPAIIQANLLAAIKAYSAKNSLQISNNLSEIAAAGDNAVTTATTNLGFTSGTNGNGAYRTMPQGGQFCRQFATVPANGSFTWTYPLAFTAQPAIFFAVLTPPSQVTAQLWYSGVGASNCIIFNNNTFAVNVDLMAFF